MVVSSVVFLLACLVGFALASVALWSKSVWKRGRSCPRCACPTFLLAPPRPFRRLSRYIGERWCPACDWKCLAFRRVRSREVAEQLKRKGYGPRWSVFRPTPNRPPGWASGGKLTAITPSTPAEEKDDGGREPRDQEPLPYPFRWGPPSQPEGRRPLPSAPRQNTRPSFPALYTDRERAEEDPSTRGRPRPNRMPIRRIVSWGIHLPGKIRGRLRGG